MINKVFRFGLLLAFLIGMASSALPASASSSQNYTVLVGSDNTSAKVTLMSFYPHTVRIHVGDSITWLANSHEIHTVTFLAGTSLGDFLINAPSGYDSPLQINPQAFFTIAPAGGMYDGTTYANSGILSTDPGTLKTFSLTFTQLGVFDYVCYIHGEMMSGSVEVVGSDVSVSSPSQVQAQAQAELKADWLKVPAVISKAAAQVVPPVKNPDGSLTHTIIVGYGSGNIDYMGFTPGHDTVQPGDTVVWKFSPTNHAPHTITFFNGAPDLSLVEIVIGQNGPIALINPAVLFPSQAVLSGEPLNSTDFFNSGILLPGLSPDFTLKIGDTSGVLNYECILHDTSGMDGSLFAVPQNDN